MTIYDSKFLAGLHIERPKAHELPEPAPWKVTADELDEETIAAIDADVTELCRQKYQQLAADYHALGSVAWQLKSDLEFAVIDRDRFIDRSSRYLDKIQKQRRIIAVLAVALLVAVGILAR